MPEEQNVDLTMIPMTEIKPEDVGILSVRYVDGVPALVVSGGTAIPAILTVLDDTGHTVATYTATPTVRARSEPMAVEDIVLVLTGLTIP